MQKVGFLNFYFEVCIGAVYMKLSIIVITIFSFFLFIPDLWAVEINLGENTETSELGINSYIDSKINGRSIRIVFGSSYEDSFSIKPINDEKKLKSLIEDNLLYKKYVDTYFHQIKKRGPFFDKLFEMIEKEFPLVDGVEDIKVNVVFVIFRYNDSPVHGSICGWGCGFGLPIYYLETKDEKVNAIKETVDYNLKNSLSFKALSLLKSLTDN